MCSHCPPSNERFITQGWRDAATDFRNRFPQLAAAVGFEEDGASSGCLVGKGVTGYAAPVEGGAMSGTQTGSGNDSTGSGRVIAKHPNASVALGSGSGLGALIVWVVGLGGVAMPAEVGR
jgi:hypothetical protein